MAWANEVCGDDSEERAFVVATMSTMGPAEQAWLPLLIWKQVDAPRCHKGFMSMIFIAIALMAATMLTRFLQAAEEGEFEKGECPVFSFRLVFLMASFSRREGHLRF
jgi:ACS family pantothenate transporter-like MFS transporter